MSTRKWAPVLLPFTVGLLGSSLYGLQVGETWGGVPASLYCIPVVIAAISLGLRAALLVALAAGLAEGAAALWSEESVVTPLAETAVYACVAATTAALADWLRQRSLSMAIPKPPADSLEHSFNELRDSTAMSALGRVVDGLVRHFRTPITSIEGAGWVLEDPRLSTEKRQEFVGIIRKESRRLDRVLADIADFTHPRKPRRQPVKLARLVDEVIQLASPKEQGPYFLFRADIPLDFPVIPCDAELLRQALLNIVMNSVQACPGGGQIEISARLEGELAAIRVRDNGRGIAANVVDRVFDPFFTTQENSLGLGLAVALQIVTAQGGRIVIEATSESGTCISVFLPVSYSFSSPMP